MILRMRRLIVLVGLVPLTATGVVGPAAAYATVDGAPPTVAPPTVAPPTVAPPTVAPPTVAPPLPAAAGPFDCVLDGADERCEKWASVYDDRDLYDNSPLSVGPGATDEVLQMEASPAGDRVFTFGESCAVDGCRWGVVAHHAESGAQLWASHEGAGASLVQIAVSGDGSRVYATGAVYPQVRQGDGDPLIHSDVVTIAWDAANGQKLWERSYGTAPVGHRGGVKYNLHSEDGGVGVVASPVDDRVYITGYTEDRDGFFDVLVIAYDGTTGTREWVATYDTSSPDVPYARDSAVSVPPRIGADGTTLYMAARSEDRDVLLAWLGHDRTNPTADGTLRWVSELPGRPRFLELAGGGSRIYLGVFFGDSDWLVAYDAIGGQAWLPRRIPVVATGLAVSPADDRIFVTGLLTGDYGTVAFDAATGEKLWDAVYDGWSPEGDRRDIASAIAAAPDGTRVYVTGISSGESEAVTGRQATVAYDAVTGGEEWVAVYSRPLDTEAFGGAHLGVGTDGTVFTAATLLRNVESTSRFLTGGGAAFPTKNLSDWGVQAY